MDRALSTVEVGRRGFGFKELIALRWWIVSPVGDWGDDVSLGTDEAAAKEDLHVTQPQCVILTLIVRLLELIFTCQTIYNHCSLKLRLSSHLPIFKIAQTSTMTSLKHKIEAVRYEVCGSSNLESSEEDLDLDGPMIWRIVVFHFASSTPLTICLSIL